MGYSTYLFDFDYTLADTETAIIICYRHVLETNGFYGVTDEAIKRTIGHPVTDSFTMLTGVNEPDTLQIFRAEFVKKADEIMVNNSALYPTVPPLLRKLKEQGFKTGIISTKYRYRIIGTLEKFAMTELVDIVLGGEDVDQPKPDPEGILKAIERLGVTKREALYTGDSLIDANAAKNAGIDFVAVTTGVTAAGEFEGLPYKKIICDLSELID